MNKALLYEVDWAYPYGISVQHSIWHDFHTLRETLPKGMCDYIDTKECQILVNGVEVSKDYLTKKICEVASPDSSIIYICANGKDA